jgi:AsnC-like helix-turn-helix protein
MSRSYVLVQTDVGRAVEIAEAAVVLPGVTFADAVTGPYDLVVALEGDGVQALGALQKLPGVTRTISCGPTITLP